MKYNYNKIPLNSNYRDLILSLSLRQNEIDNATGKYVKRKKAGNGKGGEGQITEVNKKSEKQDIT